MSSHASPYGRVLDSRRMPGGKWFEGAQLNYAEHALRASDARPHDIAVVGVSLPRSATPWPRSATATSYGAAGPSAFDCSGLTMMSWAQAGVGLPHSSSAQYGSGPHVASSALQPGDLVFYYQPISHVGMYIGNGMIVHAANPSTGVVVSGAVLHAVLRRRSPWLTHTSRKAGRPPLVGGRPFAVPAAGRRPPRLGGARRRPVRRADADAGRPDRGPSAGRRGAQRASRRPSRRAAGRAAERARGPRRRARPATSWPPWSRTPRPRGSTTSR